MARDLLFREKRCDRCGHTFVPTGARSRYCSADCRRDGLSPVQSGLDLIGVRFGRLIVDQGSTRRGPDQRRQRSTYVSYDAHWICVCDCGNIKRISQAGLRSGQIRSCGCLLRETTAARQSARKGPDNPLWKGGLNSSGYSRQTLAGKNVLIHRVVMEQMLGRPLLPEETVHHINGVRTDNRPKNLELWTSRHPKGQRVEDKVAWAVEILRLYKPEMIAGE